MHINEIAKEVHNLALEKGWWPLSGRPTVSEIIEKLCLIHSEVSEALECLRNGEMSTQLGHDDKPEGFGVELADVVIRVFDLCAQMGIDIETEILGKHKFNKTRPFRHGGKQA